MGNTLGARIKQIRVQKKMTLEEFANEIRKQTDNKSKTGKSNVSKWERDENVPNDITLKAIADLGNMSVDELLYGNIRSYLFNNLKMFTDDLEYGNDGIYGKIYTRVAYDMEKENISYSDITRIKELFKKNLALQHDEDLSERKKSVEFLERHVETAKKVVDGFKNKFYISDKNYDELYSMPVDELIDKVKESSLEEWYARYYEYVVSIIDKTKSYLGMSNDLFVFERAEVQIGELKEFLNYLNSSSPLFLRQVDMISLPINDVTISNYDYMVAIYDENKKCYFFPLDDKLGNENHKKIFEGRKHFIIYQGEIYIEIIENNMCVIDGKIINVRNLQFCSPVVAKIY